MEYNYFNVSNEDRNKWEEICPPGEYRTISGSEISYLLNPLLSKDLTNKYASVLIAGSATSDGIVYYMANGNRVDNPKNMIDQMPFGLAFIGNITSGCACLIQHGDWEGRSIPQPEGFWDNISASGLASIFPLSELPCEPSGKLADLKINSQRDAFKELVKVLKNNVGE